MKVRRFVNGAGMGVAALAVVVVGLGSFAPAAAGVDVDAVIAQVDLSAYECPPYTTYCRTGTQCDGYCGAPGAGACVRGCCACTF